MCEKNVNCILKMFFNEVLYTRNVDKHIDTIIINFKKNILYYLT